MTKHNHRNPSQALPKRGSRMAIRGIPGPQLVVSRHAQFDNGEVEVVYVDIDGRICRVWLPADILAASRTPFAPGTR